MTRFPAVLRVLALVPAILATACASGGATAPGPFHEPVGGGSALFSNAVRTGDLVFTSGVIGRSAQNDIGEATRQALSGVRDRIEAGGSSMEHAVKCTVFLVDMGDYQGMNEAYVEFFPGSPPARTAVAVLELPAGAQVEVECIAAVPN
jgi:2-iminobutanoate/2-iminopropanoate deaminase